MGHQQLNMDEYFGWKAGLSEKKPSDDKTGETTGAEEETAQPATVLTQVEDLEEHQLHKIWTLMGFSHDCSRGFLPSPFR